MLHIFTLSFSPFLSMCCATGNRQRVEDCRDHPYLRPGPFIGSGMNGLRLAPSGMEPVGAGAADPRMGLNTPPEMCPGCECVCVSVNVCRCTFEIDSERERDSVCECERERERTR